MSTASFSNTLHMRMYVYIQQVVSTVTMETTRTQQCSHLHCLFCAKGCEYMTKNSNFYQEAKFKLR